METSVCKLLLALLVTVTVAEAMNYIAFPRMGRSGKIRVVNRTRSGQLENITAPEFSNISETSQGYIAFPRLGRGYLAFPRLGRSQSGNDANDEASASCCPLGLKTEWILAEAGKADTRNICPAEAPCCEELQEILDQRPDGSFYSMCVPSCYSDSHKASEASDAVLRKLKGML
ncbi:small cardioactive peptides-like isoform X1 [Pomacea canaliculata]|uniref:small cardioactive peptides-like isoform X1 n=1 Tax=Pomacea canaliculata TaxID=400727 RepID=UPI000D72D766|nr:small cardioactive peptides-like isoform X1 [Pomacea canaliculata]